MDVTFLRTDYSTGTWPISVAIGDLNGDNEDGCQLQVIDWALIVEGILEAADREEREVNNEEKENG
jgi:hypothetical protein